VGDGTRHHHRGEHRVPVSWTVERVLALAPDAASAKSGRDLANRRKWRSVAQAQGEDGAVVLWGECQGSGKDPYLTRLDTAEPAFKCSCPSRKFPCKHALGLLLMYAESPAEFSSVEPPGWVAEWLESRSTRAERRAAREATQGPPDTAAQAKRIAGREQRVVAGLAELQRWLADLVRQGLSTAPTRSASSWEQMAARLVDAQASGAARLVRQLPGVVASGDGWPERLLERLARLQLLIDAYARLNALPPDLAADVRSLVGWTTSQDSVLEGDGVYDRWTVVGTRVIDEEPLRMQRTWFWGTNTRRAALLLSFTPAGAPAPIESAFAPGTGFDGDVVFYPSAYPMRAMIKERGELTKSEPSTGFATIREGIARFAEALGRLPWLERFPMMLRDVVPTTANRAWRIRDSLGAWLPLSDRIGLNRLLAVSGGEPVQVFGEWNGTELLPLAVSGESGVFSIE
jgi:hypothetical protein